MVGKPNPEAKSKRLVFSPETEEERILSKKAKEQLPQRRLLRLRYA